MQGKTVMGITTEGIPKNTLKLTVSSAEAHIIPIWNVVLQRPANVQVTNIVSKVKKLFKGSTT